MKIRHRCANTLCRKVISDHDRRRFSGYCSHECRVDHQRAMNRHHLNWRPSNFMSDQHRERPAVLRRNGKDNRS